MPQDNVDLVSRAYDAFADGDLETAIAIFSPDVEIEDHDRSLSSPLVDRGPDGFLRLVARANEGFEEVRYAPDAFTEAGSRVLVDVRRTGRGSASGVPVEERQFHVWDMEDGRAVRLRAFLERAQALEAAGLPG
jgi:ketosteroid isomerase-like protein